MLELEASKEILGELFDVRTHEVDEMIWQIMEERILYGRVVVNLLFRDVLLDLIQFCESLNYRFSNFPRYCSRSPFAPTPFF
jgi:hypothetical protein